MDNNYSTKLNQLQGMLKDAEKVGLNFKELCDLINTLHVNASDETIRMVLISSFSDGKTSTIAGLLGRVEENMKIDSDESSDEIVVYRPQGLRQGFEIVDTPGLFGSKEKEIDGESVRFSEITEKYISQAHIILYLCDAVTPLKESHAYVIQRLMREFNKLDSTIFVINKMDEAGYDLLNEKSFANGVKIKTDNLKKRLKDTIGLTDDEESRLHIVCIAADPKGKGIQKWFNTNPDGYQQRSHIDVLRSEIDKVVENTNAKEVINQTNANTLIDLTQQASAIVKVEKDNINNTIQKVNEKASEIQADVVLLQKDLKSSRNEMEKQLDDLENSLLSDLNSATPDTIGDILELQIGTSSEGVDFSKMERKIMHIISDCTESNNVAITTRLKDIENKISLQNELLQEGLQRGAKVASNFLKNTKITGETVKAIRDVIAKGFKFKPWGAIKLANKVNKAMPWVGAGIETGMTIFVTIKERKQEKEFEEMIRILKDGVKDTFKEVFASFKDDEEYYRNYVPSFLLLRKQLDERQAQQAQLSQLAGQYDEVATRLSSWLQQQAEDTDYEEV